MKSRGGGGGGYEIDWGGAMKLIGGAMKWMWGGGGRASGARTRPPLGFVGDGRGSGSVAARVWFLPLHNTRTTSDPPPALNTALQRLDFAVLLD